MRSYDTCNTFSCNEKKNMREAELRNRAEQGRFILRRNSSLMWIHFGLHNSENGFRTVAEAELGLLLPLHKRFLFICYAYVLLLPCVYIEGLLFLFLPPILMHIWSSLTMYSNFRPLWRQLPNTRHFSISKYISYLKSQFIAFDTVWDESFFHKIFLWVFVTNKKHETLWPFYNWDFIVLLLSTKVYVLRKINQKSGFSLSIRLG